MGENIEFLNENLLERKRALEQYSEENIALRKVLKEAIEEFGCRCMLGGILNYKNKITLHHIIPKTDGGPSNMKNSALLSRIKHERFNYIEKYFPELAMDVNAYLYLYRGICFDENVLSKINSIMVLSDNSDVIVEMLRTLGSKETINTLINQHEQNQNYKSNCLVAFPGKIDELLPILKNHFATIYMELYNYIMTYGIDSCDVEIASRINRILMLAQFQKIVVDKSLPIMDQRVEILEEVKSDLKTQTIKLKTAKAMKKGIQSTNN